MPTQLTAISRIGNARQVAPNYAIYVAIVLFPGGTLIENLFASEPDDFVRYGVYTCRQEHRMLFSVVHVSVFKVGLISGGRRWFVGGNLL